MKKSEMIEVIYRELETWQDCELTKQTALEILNVIQDYGMLPPQVDEIDNLYWESEDE